MEEGHNHDSGRSGASNYCTFLTEGRRRSRPSWGLVKDVNSDDDQEMPSHCMELELLDKKIKRLVQKLKKHDVHLEVFDHTDITYGRMLGKGGEGIVYKCTVVYNGLPVDAACKKVLNNTDDAITITLDEIELLCLARDPIITTTLQVYGVAAVPSCPGSDFGHLVILTEAGIMNALQLYQDEEVPAYVTYDLWARLAAGIACMHSKRIIHQDLKPENVLVTGIARDPLGQIERIDFKVIDLGMAKRFFTEKLSPEDILGTNGYHAPEMLLEDDYDFKADVFMLGITFCVMLHGPMFLKSSCLQNLLLQIHDAKHRHITGKKLFESVIEPSLHPMHGELPEEIKTMICNMLEKQESRDISLVDVSTTCREQSKFLMQQQRLLPPVLSPERMSVSCRTDSGISSTAKPDSTESKVKSVQRARRTRTASTAKNDSHASEETKRPRRNTRRDSSPEFVGRVTRSSSVCSGSVSSRASPPDVLQEIDENTPVKRYPKRGNRVDQKCFIRLSYLHGGFVEMQNAHIKKDGDDEEEDDDDDDDEDEETEENESENECDESEEEEEEKKAVKLPPRRKLPKRSKRPKKFIY